MIVDQNIPLERQLQQSRLLPLRGEHSTPDLHSNRGLYSSCYGFDELASPLPFSPVGEPMISSQYVAGSPGSISVTSSVTSISPAKRKADVRVYDVPIEKPTKKMRKKKTTTVLVRGLLLILYFCIAFKSSVDTKIISLHLSSGAGRGHRAVI